MTDVTVPHRLGVPYPIVIRAVQGEADLAVVIEHAENGLRLALWDGDSRTLTRVPFDSVTYATTVSPDGRFILDLDDPSGSELGHLHAFPLEGGPSRDLTPLAGAYTVRGIDCGVSSTRVLVTCADESGFFAVVTDVESPDAARVVFRSSNEAWSAVLSADESLLAIETTDHNPGVRRFAVTVIDVESGAVVNSLSDGPLGPVRRVRFAQEAGDSRLLAYSEISGFARPLIWDPMSGERVGLALPELTGDVIPLDWHSPTGRVLLAHVDLGQHRLLEHDLVTGLTAPLVHPPGAYFEPDTGAEFPLIWSSYYSQDGVRRLVRSSWDVPLHILESHGESSCSVALPPPSIPPATSFTSHIISASDGVESQLWVGLPADPSRRRGTILEVHGGPNLVSVDRYDAIAQSWIDDGWVYASLNYRGSVTFGRAFRELYWQRVGQGEMLDIASAMEWLAARGLADHASSFITGSSYGGFLTLMALGKLPDLFAGGLAHVAQADWVAAYPQMNSALQAAWRGFIGSDPQVDPGPWEKASPISYVASVRAPVWLNQGSHDTRTPPEQARKYADSLRQAGGDVVLDWFQGGHMPGGLAGMSRDYLRMRQLVERTLRGHRWSDDTS